MFEIVERLSALLRYQGYKPQPLTMKRVKRWLDQFEGEDRKHVLRLLRSVIYLSESTVRKILVDQNSALMARLAAAGVPPKKCIYVQVHEAGSSSPVMLNLLRDAAQLEQRGCRFVDGNDTLGLNRITSKVADGALIYVDDFVGTGNQ